MIEAPQGSIGTGYATNAAGARVCYACCADVDRDFMREHGQIALYLTSLRGSSGEVTNWPGSLRFAVKGRKEGSHNFTGYRVDVWFDFDGSEWRGVLYGRNTQVVHCRRTKAV